MPARTRASASGFANLARRSTIRLGLGVRRRPAARHDVPMSKGA